MEHCQKLQVQKQNIFKIITQDISTQHLKLIKLNPEQDKTKNIKEIPTRMIWAIGNTFLSRITTMLQNLIKNIAINYCKTEINEYCKDSDQYL